MGKKNVGILRILLTGDAAQFEKTMNRASKRMMRFSRRAKQLGSDLMLGVTLPLVAAGGAALKFATDLNKGMANVATLIPGQIARVKELKVGVQDMAIATGKSTADLTEGLYQVISAFGDTSESLAKLELNARAGAAGLASTANALAYTSAVTKAYGDISFEATKKAADLAFKVIELGQTTFPELAEAIGRVVPLAATLKVKQVELSAGFATLTGVTGKTSEVSTQLAAIMRAMIKQTEPMRVAIRRLGYDTAEAMVAELGLVDALTRLIGTTDGTQEAVAKLFGRAEALNAVFALTGAQAETFREKLAKLKDSTGALDKAWDEQTKGINKFGFQLNVLKERTLALARQFGEALIPAFSTILDKLEPMTESAGKLAKAFADMDPKLQGIAVSAGLIAAASGPIIKLVGALTGAGAIAGMGAVGKFGKGILAFAAAHPLIAAALAATAGLYFIYEKWLKLEPPEPGHPPGRKLPDIIKLPEFEIPELLIIGKKVEKEVLAEDGWLTRLVNKFSDFEMVIQSWGDTMAEELTATIVHGQNFAETMHNVFTRVIEDIIRLILYLKIVQPLVRSLQGALGLDQTYGPLAPQTGAGKYDAPIGGQPSGLSLAGVGGPTVQIFNNAASTGPARVEQTRGPMGRPMVKVYIEDAVEEAIAGGRFDSTLGRTFGMRRRGVRR